MYACHIHQWSREMGARKHGPVCIEPHAQYKYLLCQLPDQSLIFKMRREAQWGCDVSKVTEVSDRQGRIPASWVQPALCPHTLPENLLQPMLFGSYGACETPQQVLSEVSAMAPFYRGRK